MKGDEVGTEDHPDRMERGWVAERRCVRLQIEENGFDSRLNLRAKESVNRW